MPSKEDVLLNFDPNGVGITGNLFGLPFTPINADLVIIPVPWEVTVSSKTGTANAPQRVLDVSSQIDLCSHEIEDVWKLGVAMLEIPYKLKAESDRLRKLAALHIHSLETRPIDESSKIITSKINEAGENLIIYVNHMAQQLLSEGKLVGLLGGDHSTPLGLLKALGKKHQFGILQLDAHADLRKGYNNFTYSHASIMHHALRNKSVTKLVQVGVRDFCDQELQLIKGNPERINTFFNADIQADMYGGKAWALICESIVKELPKSVYISFDVDALDPTLCPTTGTPVPGGLAFDQAIYLIKQLVLAGKRIIGFDLCEVSGTTDWDAQVGARLLFELCHWAAVSQGKLRLRR